MRRAFADPSCISSQGKEDRLVTGSVAKDNTKANEYSVPSVAITSHHERMVGSVLENTLQYSQKEMPQLNLVATNLHVNLDRISSQFSLGYSFWLYCR